MRPDTKGTDFMMDLEKLSDIDNAPCQPIEDITALKETMLKLQGAKFEYMEPILNGDGITDIGGLILYFMLSSGEMVAIEAYPNEGEPDKLVVNEYMGEELGNSKIGLQ